MMKVNKYLVLHSGDSILLSSGMDISCLTTATEYYNKDILSQIKHCVKDVQDSASHIELVPTFKLMGNSRRK
jgi:hypothetical protein